MTHAIVLQVVRNGISGVTIAAHISRLASDIRAPHTICHRLQAVDLKHPTQEPPAGFSPSFTVLG